MMNSHAELRLITLGYALVVFAANVAPEGKDIYALAKDFETYVETGKSPL